jgi:hypothetical protein
VTMLIGVDPALGPDETVMLRRYPDGRIETFDAPLCQKAMRAGNLGPPCAAFAPYQVLVDMFPGCPNWYGACGKHAQLAVMSGRAFDWRPHARLTEVTT